MEEIIIKIIRREKIDISSSQETRLNRPQNMPDPALKTDIKILMKVSSLLNWYAIKFTFQNYIRTHNAKNIHGTDRFRSEGH